jgi:hypothetical protein
MYQSLSSHSGIANCYESIPIGGTTEGPILGSLVSSLPEGWQWKREQWNRFRFRSKEAERKSVTLELNMNHHSGWHVINQGSARASVVSSGKENLRIGTTAGKVDFYLVHEDQGIRQGLRITMWSALALVALLAGALSIFRFNW